MDFNPRSPRGERLIYDTDDAVWTEISIHAPREGSDVQSIRRVLLRGISIHAPREGSDLSETLSLLGIHHFNPRSPRGERRGSL